MVSFAIVARLDSRLGSPLKIKIPDGGIQRSTFIAKHDFSINQKISVQEPCKVSIFSCQDKTDVSDRELNPGF